MVVSRVSDRSGRGRARPAAPEASDELLVQLIRQLNVELDRFAEMFGQAHGLYRTDLSALVVIMDADRRGETMTPTRLAKALNLSASATTAVLDRLEKAGHLRRDRSADDRRRVHLVMPERTLRLGAQLFGPLGEAYARAWAGFDAAERATIVRFLQATIDTTVAVRTESPKSDNGQA